MISGTPALDASQRAKLLELVDRYFGLRGSEYAASRLDDAVSAALTASGQSSAFELLDSHEEGCCPRWLYALAEYLTVGETYFLRDAAQMAAFREQVLPEVVARRVNERRLRIWSAGCSTGEEAYSLAILL